MDSLRAVVWEVRCIGWECEADRWQPWSKPLRVEGSKGTAIRRIREQGWTHARARGSWWCPRHSAIGNARNQQISEHSGPCVWADDPDGTWWSCDNCRKARNQQVGGER